MNVDAVVLGVAMAVSPLAVLASVLLLTTERGVAKAAAYAVGWVIAVGLVGAATVVASSQVKAGSGSTTSTALAWVDVVLGVALVIWAFGRRAGAREGVTQPSWMRRLDRMSPVVAFGFGLFMPPYAIAAAAASSIMRSDATGSGDVVVAVVTFTVLASLGVIVPVVVAVTSSRSEEMLARWREWLLGHWPTVLFWMLVLIGAYLVGKGAAALLS